MFIVVIHVAHDDIIKTIAVDISRAGDSAAASAIRGTVKKPIGCHH